DEWIDLLDLAAEQIEVLLRVRDVGDDQVEDQRPSHSPGEQTVDRGWRPAGGPIPGASSLLSVGGPQPVASISRDAARALSDSFRRRVSSRSRSRRSRGSATESGRGSNDVRIPGAPLS